MTEAVERYLAWIKVVGWDMPGVHMNTRIAAVEFYEIEKGKPTDPGAGPYRLKPGVVVENDFTRAADLLARAGYRCTGQVRNGSRRKAVLVQFRREDGQTLVLHRKGFVFGGKPFAGIVARTNEELAEFLGLKG